MHVKVFKVLSLRPLKLHKTELLKLHASYLNTYRCMLTCYFMG